MRIVADTNVVVSGFLWEGNERRLMDAARDEIVSLYTSETLLAEFEEVLARPKFAVRLTAKNVDRRSLVDEYAELAFVVHNEPIIRAVSRDSDDDHVLACAIAGECEIIVTGDDDLLDLKAHRGIRILTATVFLAELNL